MTNIERKFYKFRCVCPELSPNNINFNNYGIYIYILNQTSHISEINDLVIQNWDNYILNLYECSRDGDDLDSIYYLFEEYEQSYKEFIDNESNNNLIKEKIIEYLSEAIEEGIKENQFNYHFNEEINHYLDHHGEAEYDLVGYSLNEDIDELISNEFNEYEGMAFLMNGPYIDVDELNIETDYLVKQLEESHFQDAVNSAQYNSLRHYSENKSGASNFNSPESDIDLINNLFS